MRVFDGHCDTILRCYETGEGFGHNGGEVDLFRVEHFDAYLQFFAIFGDETTTPGLPLYQLFQTEYQLFESELFKNERRIAHCRNGAEAEAATRSGRVAAFLSVEGAELLDCDEDKLETAYNMGVRAVNLTWNHANLLSGSNAEERDRGLSQRGRSFVARMAKKGMLVDVSHLSDPGFWDVAELMEGPFFASHSNARSVFSNPRNLTDAQFTAIMEHRGVVGLNFYAGFLGEDPDVDTVIAHLEHFLALGGEKTVSLGGDWDGCSALPRGFCGISDLTKLYERLLQRNYSETLLDALFYANLMRVVNDVCTM
ncbi:MAG: dipeptidase [Oscillospiraceae bacterium]